MVRFATIGTSDITRRFLDALEQVEGASYVAAYSRSLSRAREFGQLRGASEFVDSLDDLAALPDVDAVYIASPIGLHARQAAKMVQAGKHVLVEKAFAATEVEARAVFDQAHRSGAVCLEAMRSLHGPGWERVEEVVKELGTVRSASVRFSKVTSRIKRLRAGERLNVFDPLLAEGALMDIGVYAVEPMVALFGKPRTVSAAAVTTSVPGNSPDDAYASIDLQGSAVLGFDGLVGEVSWGKVCDDLLSSQIAGEDATLTWNDTCLPHHLTVVKHADAGMTYGARTSGEVSEIEVPHNDNDMVYEIENFVAAVEGNAAARSRIDRFEQITCDSLSVMDAIRKDCGIRFPADDE